MYLKFNDLLKKITTSYLSEQPFVAFKKPNESSLNAFFQNSDELIELNSFEQSGFVFAPFSKNERKVLFPSEKCLYYTSEIELENNVDLQFQNIISKNTNEVGKKKHIELVSKTIQFLKTSKVNKIVISRIESLDFDSKNSLKSFNKMLHNYPDAFVYFWFHPKVGCWMGATPELLLKANDLEFSTVALAGTQVNLGGNEVIWRQKELQEQQYVVDYILKVLKKTAKTIELSKLQTVKASNLLHLKTEIFGKLKSDKTVGNLIKVIHPTPAVCGMPKKESLNYIVENERYNRSYYTGYLGTLNIEKNSHLFVNLRCVQLKDSKALLYVGGGITDESNPESEWNETVSKAETMKNVL